MEESSKSRGANYRTHVALCSAWLEATCDPICGIYQSGDDFYAKVKCAFDTALRAEGKWVADRKPDSLSQRFLTISRAVSKFVGCYEHVLGTLGSGRSPTDVQADAIALYESEKSNGTFKYAQCWGILKDSAKWGAWREANHYLESGQPVTHRVWFCPVTERVDACAGGRSTAPPLGRHP